jgi:hypothetical protein
MKKTPINIKYTVRTKLQPQCSMSVSRKRLEIFLIIIVLLSAIGCCYYYIKTEKFYDNNNSNKNKIYLFRTASCPYSIQFLPIWTKFKENNKYNNNLECINVDLNDNSANNVPNINLAKQLKVKNVPTVYLIKSNNNAVKLEQNTLNGLQQLIN